MVEAGKGRPFGGIRLAGDGFLLRAWRCEDLPALVRHANDEEVARGLSDRFPHPYTREDGERFLAGEVVDLSGPVFAIEIGGEACGSIGLRLGCGDRGHTGELGYWLARSHWGQGLMTRIVAAYLDWAVPACGLLRVQAVVLVGNTASARVLLNNGFQEEGVQRATLRQGGQLHDLWMFGRPG